MDNTATVITDGAKAAIDALQGNWLGTVENGAEAIAAACGWDFLSVGALVSKLQTTPLTPAQEASVQETLRNGH